MTGGWFAAPADAWGAARDALTRASVTFDEAMAVADLRWWDDRVRMGRAKRIPGARSLCREWGWTEYAARQLMRDEARWMDPRHRTILARPSHGDRTLVARPDATSTAFSPENHTPIARDSHATRTIAATRADQHTHTHKHTHTSSSNSTAAAAEPDSVSQVWTRIQEARAKHQPGARGQSLTQSRRRNLRARLAELRTAGHDADALVRAVAWVHTSPNMRAEGARKTGDPVTTLLRARNCVDYVELSAHEGAGGSPVAASPTDTGSQAWRHVLTFTQRGELADRIRAGRLGPDPAEHDRRLAAIKGAGGFAAFRTLDHFSERRIRDAFLDAYNGARA